MNEYYNYKFENTARETIWSVAKKYLKSIKWFEILKKGIFVPKNSFYEKDVCDNEQNLMFAYHYIQNNKEYCENITKLKFELTDEVIEDKRFFCGFTNLIKVSLNEEM